MDTELFTGGEGRRLPLKSLAETEETVFSESEKLYIRQLVGELIAEALVAGGLAEQE